MKIGVIGGSGFLGGEVVSYLSQYRNNVVSITRNNYKNNVGKYDVIINCNGNSKKYLANANPVKDFEESVHSVYKSMFDFDCDLYIYISSSDVYDHSYHLPIREFVLPYTKNISVYGYNKLLAEDIVKKYKDKFLILRCASIIGDNMVKGVLYDVVNNNQLFVSRHSKIQFITAYEISSIIKTFIDTNVVNEVFNVGGVGTTSMDYIESIIKRKLSFRDGCDAQYYNMCVDKLAGVYPLRESNEYVLEVLNERME